MSEIENYFTLVPRLEKARDESDLLGIEYKRVMDGFSFILHSPHQVQSVTVHRGFLTNGSSLPFIVQRLIDKWIGLDHPSVILNDWLSEYLLIEVNYKGILINNYDALDIFIKALELTKLTSFQIKVIHILCGIKNITKRPYSTRLHPYKRYVEDRSYGTCD